MNSASLSRTKLLKDNIPFYDNICHGFKCVLFKACFSQLLDIKYLYVKNKAIMITLKFGEKVDISFSV